MHEADAGHEAQGGPRSGDPGVHAPDPDERAQGEQREEDGEERPARGQRPSTVPEAEQDHGWCRQGQGGRVFGEAVQSLSLQPVVAGPPEQPMVRIGHEVGEGVHPPRATAPVDVGGDELSVGDPCHHRVEEGKEGDAGGHDAHRTEPGPGAEGEVGL